MAPGTLKCASYLYKVFAVSYWIISMSSLQSYWHESKSSTFFTALLCWELYFFLNSHYFFSSQKRNSLTKKSHFNSLVTESKNKTYTSCSERVFPKKKTALKFCTLDILRISTTWYFLWRFFFITCKGTIIINMLFLLQTNLHKIFWHTKHVSYLIALKNIMSISFSFAICYKIQYICRKNYFGFHEIHFQAVKVISVWVYHGSFCE